MEQRQDDDQRPLAEVARQRRVGRKLVHETHQRLRAGGFRRMLPAKHQQHLARVWIAERQHVQRATLFGSPDHRSEEHTSELQSLMRNSYAVFCLKKKTISKKSIMS